MGLDITKIWFFYTSRKNGERNKRVECVECRICRFTSSSGLIVGCPYKSLSVLFLAEM